MTPTDAISIALGCLGVPAPINDHHKRAQAGLVVKALEDCGFVIVPKKDQNQ